MAGNSLGRITVDLLAKSDQFEAGLAKAADATAKFGEDVNRKKSDWEKAFTRTDSQWDNYLRLDDKVAGVTRLGKELSQLGSIVGGNLGGAFLRLAGNMERVWTLGKHLGGMKVFGGGGGLIGGLTRLAGIGAAAGVGWKIGTRIRNMTAPGYAEKDEFGRSNSIGERLTRMFAGNQVGRGSIWQIEYNKKLEETIELSRIVNLKFFAHQETLRGVAEAARVAANEQLRLYQNASGKLYEALGGDKRGKADIIAATLGELGSVTDQTSKWDKLTKKITEARQAIDWLARTGEAEPEWLTRAGGRINELEDKLKEMRYAEEEVAGVGAEKGMGGGRDFKVVDSLSRIASGGVSVAGDRQTNLLGEINAGIKQLNRNAMKPALVGG